MLKSDLTKVSKKALNLDKGLLIDINSLEFKSERSYHLGFLFNDLSTIVLPMAGVIKDLIHEYGDNVLKFGTDKDRDDPNHVQL